MEKHCIFRSVQNVSNASYPLVVSTHNRFVFSLSSVVTISGQHNNITILSELHDYTSNWPPSWRRGIRWHVAIFMSTVARRVHSFRMESGQVFWSRILPLLLDPGVPIGQRHVRVRKMSPHPNDFHSFRLESAENH